jgi:hypothetical protein
MGKTNQAFSTSSDSDGIEICSDTSNNGGGTIDFTYPYLSGQNHYAGRIFYENNNGYFGFNASYIPTSSEIIASPHMTLSQDGILNVINLITANNISATSNLYCNDLIALSDITCTGTLNISGGSVLNNITSNGTLYISGGVTTNSTLSVSGSTALRSSLIVLGTSSLRGAVSITSTLNVSGATTLNSTLNVSGAATLNNLIVNGTITGANFNKTLVGLSNVANTAPSDLPISTATQSALNNKLNNIPNASITEQYSTLTFINNNALQMGVGNEP